MDFPLHIQRNKTTPMDYTTMLKKLKLVVNDVDAPFKVRLRAAALRIRLKHWVKLTSSRGRYPTHLAKQAVALINRPVYVTMVIRADYTNPGPHGIRYTKESLEQAFAKIKLVPVVSFTPPFGDTATDRLKSYTTLAPENVLGYGVMPRLDGKRIIMSVSREVLDKIAAFERVGPRSFSVRNKPDEPAIMTELVAIDCFMSGQ